MEQKCFMRQTRPQLINGIAFITWICGTICGANNWTEMVGYAKIKRKWLEKLLELSNGIPSHDTFGRVFSLLSPEEFQR